MTLLLTGVKGYVYFLNDDRPLTSEGDAIYLTGLYDFLTEIP
jgi:hypothetical protein